MIQLGGWMGGATVRQCVVESSRDVTVAESHQDEDGAQPEPAFRGRGVSPHLPSVFPSCQQAGVP